MSSTHPEITFARAVCDVAQLPVCVDMPHPLGTVGAACCEHAALAAATRDDLVRVTTGPRCATCGRARASLFGGQRYMLVVRKGGEV